MMTVFAIAAPGICTKASDAGNSPHQQRDHEGDDQVRHLISGMEGRRDTGSRGAPTASLRAAGAPMKDEVRNAGAVRVGERWAGRERVPKAIRGVARAESLANGRAR